MPNYPLTPEERARMLAVIDNRHVVVSVSGGKDSTATALLMKELGVSYENVYCNVKWDHPRTEEFLREELPKHIGPIKWLDTPGMEDLCRQKGMFPARTRRFCTQKLKVFPLGRYLKTFDQAEPINAVGVRAAESQARAKLPEVERFSEGDCDTWRPILRWTLDDVIAIHKAHNVPPNPLYIGRGADEGTRVGCWPCIFARKMEIRALPEGRIQQIERLEAEVQAAAAARYALKGETFESLGHNRPTYFQASLRDAEGQRPCIPIREAVAWSRTKHGGRKVDPELFAAGPGDSGCLRWGMCDYQPAFTDEELELLKDPIFD